MSHLHELYDTFGQSAWIDNIRRDWLSDGTLADLVAQGARGVTSNPAIFAKAFATSDAYDELIKQVGKSDPEVVFEFLAASDVRDACDVLSDVYEESMVAFAAGERRYCDGFVSLEVSPRLARDAAATVAAAIRLREEVGRDNVMIKIPATRECLSAITDVLAQGINVNVTLIFSLARYQEVLDAWTLGVRRAKEQGLDVSTLASVASFFVSRVDAAIDQLLDDTDPRRGTIANAQVAAAYECFLAHVERDEVKALLHEGAQVQRPLWASTSPKNPSYPDLLYVDQIAADETVNTMPDATLAAALDHGNFAGSLLLDPTTRRETAALLETLDGVVNLDDVTATLEREGVDAFVNAYEELLATVAAKLSKE